MSDQENAIVIINILYFLKGLFYLRWLDTLGSGPGEHSRTIRLPIKLLFSQRTVTLGPKGTVTAAISPVELITFLSQLY